MENVSESEINMLDVEARDWESTYQRKKKQAGEIPIWVLEEWGKVISNPEDDLVDKISAWCFRVAVAAALSWGDLLNSPPNTLTSNAEGLIGFAAKAKYRGVAEGRPWGASNYAFANENGCSRATTSLCQTREV